MTPLNQRYAAFASRVSTSRCAAYGPVLLLLLATLLSYLNTFQVPWYFDDTSNIIENPLVHDLPAAARNLFFRRGIATFSFALNYHWGGLDPAGFHLVNLAIHAGTVVLVWQVLRRILGANLWALAGALLFAVHPLQTQAVTYVVQRMTSLSGMFFMASVAAYFAFLAASGWQRRVHYGLSLLCGVLATMTKENAAVLPLVLLLSERYFQPGRPWRQQMLGVLPFCLPPLLIAAQMLAGAGGVTAGTDLGGIARFSDQLLSLRYNTPLNYLVTEFSVLWLYLRLLVWPFGQMLDYGWPVVSGGLPLPNAVALAGLLGLAVLAWRLRQSRPLLSFGIVWFFATLIVESSIIPLDPVFEHRLYLPMVGFVLVLIDLLRTISRQWVQYVVMAALIAICMVLTWQRNALWNDPVAFLEDNLRGSPNNERVMVMLGNAYVTAGRAEDGLRMIERARQLNPGYDPVYTAGAKILIDRQEGARAIPLLQEGLRHNPRYAVLYEYLGIAYGQAGNSDEAIRMLQRALQLAPRDASVLMNLGAAYSWMGNDARAIEYFQRSLEIAPQSEKTLFNYAVALFNIGDTKRSLEMLRRTVDVNPRNADAQYGRGTMALAAGYRQEAEAARDALWRLGDERAAELAALLSR